MIDKIRKNYLASIIVAVIALVYLVFTLAIDKAPIGNPLAPKIFPLVLAIGGITLSVVLFVKSRAQLKKILSGEDTKAIDEETQRGAAQRKDERQLFFLALSASVLGVVYALLFERLGFIVSTVLFLSSFMFLLNGTQRWKLNIIVPLVFSVLTYVVFSTLLSVPLPLYPDF